jgi:hypothetical protein
MAKGDDALARKRRGCEGMCFSLPTPLGLRPALQALGGLPQRNPGRGGGRIHGASDWGVELWRS